MPANSLNPLLVTVHHPRPRALKGISGNPKGDRKGSSNVATVLTKTLRERVVINEHLTQDENGTRGRANATRQ